MDGRTDRQADTHPCQPPVPFSFIQLHCLFQTVQKHLGSSYPRALALAVFSSLVPEPTHSMAHSLPLVSAQMSPFRDLSRLHSRSGIHASSLSLPPRPPGSLWLLHSVGTFICPYSPPLEGSTKAGPPPLGPAAVSPAPRPWQVLTMVVKFKNGQGWGVLPRRLSG